ncbi:hypothetical protein [Thiohalobacter thiocyanaticus]|uniref:hypothetical protein n=1 Tax=Thiohalobacter thiocyanaticus TaxID=585455 RepID=UPI000F63BCD7|nr:hypothetical protein [Thiohalobacter thiocyanaticus]
MTRSTPLAMLTIGLMLAFWGVCAWASASTDIPQLLAWMSADIGVWLTVDGLGVAIVGLIGMLHGPG